MPEPECALECNEPVFEQIAPKLHRGPRSTTRSAKGLLIVGWGRPADQARVAHTRTALKLPGGDIFLDLLSPDTRLVAPTRPRVKSQLMASAARVNQALVRGC